MDKQRIFHIGNIRPPIHADSLLLQITENCTWSKCNFCTLYRDGKFRMRPLEEIKQDIDNVVYYRDLILQRLENADPQTVKKMGTGYTSRLSYSEQICYMTVLNWIVNDGMKTVFLQDANSIVIKKEMLCEAIKYLKEKIPTVETIATYGRADTLDRLSADDFRDLKTAGLNMIHSGYESGCDDVLKLLNKGTTRQQQISAGRKVKDSGITFNIFYMPGGGGRQLSMRNAIETAEVVNAVNPDFARIRTFVVKSGAPMWEIAKGPDFDECNDIEKLLEIRTFIEHLDPKLSCYVISDHIINLLPLVQGHVNESKATMLDQIDTFLALPPQKQKEYQIARRMWGIHDPGIMHLVPHENMDKIYDLVNQFRGEDEFEKLLRSYMRNYI